MRASRLMRPRRTRRARGRQHSERRGGVSGRRRDPGSAGLAGRRDRDPRQRDRMAAWSLRGPGGASPDVRTRLSARAALSFRAGLRPRRPRLRARSHRVLPAFRRAAERRCPGGGQTVHASLPITPVHSFVPCRDQGAAEPLYEARILEELGRIRDAIPTGGSAGRRLRDERPQKGASCSRRGPARPRSSRCPNVGSSNGHSLGAVDALPETSKNCRASLLHGRSWLWVG